MKQILIGLMALLVSGKILAFGSNNIKKFKWQDLEVVYLQDERFPTYNAIFYFADGALSENASRRHGITEAMFSFLSSGTRRYSQKDIANHLEFFGVGHGASVTHEYSTYQVEGLVKDIMPTMKKVCHLFADAVFPKKEIKKDQRRLANSLKGMVNSHGALASRSFRELSLKGSPFYYPVGGKIKDIKSWDQKALKNKLAYFKKNVKKRLYLSGPESILSIKKIVLDECGFRGQGHFERKEIVQKKTLKSGPQMFLVTVPEANQVQVRIGRLMSQSEIQDPELLTFSYEFLGGGFTSQLMRELRVKRGLTYSVGAFASGQKYYGRAGISTFTKNETLGNLLQVTKETIEKISKGEFERKSFERTKGNVAGSYPFRFEKSDIYLSQLLYLDHIGMDYKRLYEFPQLINKKTPEEVAQNINDVFSWNQQVIVVVGPKSVLPQMKKFGRVTVKSYKDFL